MAEKVIVLRNGEYLIDEKTRDFTPKDTVFTLPKHASNNSITLKNFVEITLVRPWDFNVNKYVVSTYNDTVINEITGGMEQVFSSILTFKDFTKSELDEIIKNINAEENKEIISALEYSIEELKTEKSNLENEVRELKEIKDAANKIIEYAEIFKNAIESTNKVES
jgi:phosphomevalonate kinase